MPRGRADDYELEHMGVPFSRLPDGRIAQRPFGGHSNPRAAYAADRTGHALLHTLYGELIRYNVKVYPESYMLSLVIEDNECRGVTVLDIRTGAIDVINAKATMFATGGYGRAFKITSNSFASTGDGITAAYRAGVPLEDMEFVQFHPTGLYSHGILLSEGARGEGGYLLNGNNERFMARYAPGRMELAPRDVVSRSIYTEIEAGRGAGPNGDYVLLDLRHLGKKKLDERLPQITELARDYLGVDPIDEPVPIQPTAHYSMGGIPTDADGRVITGENTVSVVSSLPENVPASRCMAPTGSVPTRCSKPRPMDGAPARPSPTSSTASARYSRRCRPMSSAKPKMKSQAAQP